MIPVTHFLQNAVILLSVRTFSLTTRKRWCLAAGVSGSLQTQLVEEKRCDLQWFSWIKAIWLVLFERMHVSVAEKCSHVVWRIRGTDRARTNGAYRIDCAVSFLVFAGLTSVINFVRWQWNVESRLTNHRFAFCRCWRGLDVVVIEKNIVDRLLHSTNCVEFAGLDGVFRFLDLLHHLLLPLIHRVLMMVVTSHWNWFELLKVEVLVRFLFRLSFATKKAQSSCLRLSLHVFSIKVLQTWLLIQNVHQLWIVDIVIEWRRWCRHATLALAQLHCLMFNDRLAWNREIAGVVAIARATAVIYDGKDLGFAIDRDDSWVVR